MTSPTRVAIRRWRPDDLPHIVACHHAAYPDYPADGLYDERIYRMQLEAFPEGQLLAEVNGRVVGYATSLIVQLDDAMDHYRYDEITAAGTFSTHDPSGDTLYGADIAVHPDARGQGVAGRLYQGRKRLVRRYNLRRMLAYGRLPGYRDWAGRTTPDEYVAAVREGRIRDQALSAHLRAGYTVSRVLLDFVRDPASLNYATWLEWANPRHDRAKRTIAAGPIRRPVRRIRVCAAQWMMRRIDHWEAFAQTAEFFVDTANAYHCHFVLLPEYFTAQLIYIMKHDGDFDRAVRELSQYHDRYCELFTDLARRYQIYIIAGTTPTIRDDHLYNTAHLFTPAGGCYVQDKLHVTPDERTAWGVQAGERIQVFDTPMARIAIQVCYDVEFPELARLHALAGAEVVFVPFSTDERKAFNRVRYAAQSRAVENYLYVVTAGNVGNLPTISNYLINYAQSAIYTPSDFAFPLDGIAGCADPNVETVVIADLDLMVLEHQREFGSVRPFFDRRSDLYQLQGVPNPTVVRVE